MVKDVIQHEKESAGKHRKIENFQAQLPGSFAQNEFRLENLNYQDTCKLFCSQESQSIGLPRGVCTALVYVAS